MILFKFLFFGIANTIEIDFNSTECNEEICRAPVNWCFMSASQIGQNGRGKLIAVDKATEENCRSCDPDHDRKIHNGKCPCCERCARCLKQNYDDCCHCLPGLCPAKNTGQSEREHNKDGNMKIIVLHFTPEDYDIERFVELTDVKIDNLIDFEFEVYDHNEAVKKTDNTHHRRVFYNKCMEYAECATQCQTMGAGHTRWYHTGCCECLDPRISRLNRNPQPMCKKCSMDSEPFFQDL